MKLRLLPLLLAVAATMALASCGGSGSSSAGKDLAAAKQRMINDCHKGHAGDSADLAQCQCIVGHLSAQFNTAKQYNDADNAVNAGHAPAAVTTAAGGCPRPGGSGTTTTPRSGGGVAPTPTNTTSGAGGSGY